MNEIQYRKLKQEYKLINSSNDLVRLDKGGQRMLTVTKREGAWQVVWCGVFDKPYYECETSPLCCFNYYNRPLHYSY